MNYMAMREVYFRFCAIFFFFRAISCKPRSLALLGHGPVNVAVLRVRRKDFKGGDERLLVEEVRRISGSFRDAVLIHDQH